MFSSSSSPSPSSSPSSNHYQPYYRYNNNITANTTTTTTTTNNSKNNNKIPQHVTPSPPASINEIYDYFHSQQYPLIHSPSSPSSFPPFSSIIPPDVYSPSFSSFLSTLLTPSYSSPLLSFSLPPQVILLFSSSPPPIPITTIQYSSLVKCIEYIHSLVIGNPYSLPSHSFFPLSQFIFSIITYPSDVDAASYSLIITVLSSPSFLHIRNWLRRTFSSSSSSLTLPHLSSPSPLFSLPTTFISQYTENLLYKFNKYSLQCHHVTTEWEDEKRVQNGQKMEEEGEKIEVTKILTKIEMIQRGGQREWKMVLGMEMEMEMEMDDDDDNDSDNEEDKGEKEKQKDNEIGMVYDDDGADPHDVNQNALPNALKRRKVKDTETEWNISLGEKTLEEREHNCNGNDKFNKQKHSPHHLTISSHVNREEKKQEGAVSMSISMSTDDQENDDDDDDIPIVTIPNPKTQILPSLPSSPSLSSLQTSNPIFTTSTLAFPPSSSSSPSSSSPPRILSSSLLSHLADCISYIRRLLSSPTFLENRINQIEMYLRNSMKSSADQNDPNNDSSLMNMDQFAFSQSQSQSIASLSSSSTSPLSTIDNMIYDNAMFTLFIQEFTNEFRDIILKYGNDSNNIHNHNKNPHDVSLSLPIDDVRERIYLIILLDLLPSSLSHSRTNGILNIFFHSLLIDVIPHTQSFSKSVISGMFFNIIDFCSYLHTKSFQIFLLNITPSLLPFLSPWESRSSSSPSPSLTLSPPSPFVVKLYSESLSCFSSLSPSHENNISLPSIPILHSFVGNSSSPPPKHISFPFLLLLSIIAYTASSPSNFQWTDGLSLIVAKIFDLELATMKKSSSSSSLSSSLLTEIKMEVIKLCQMDILFAKVKNTIVTSLDRKYGESHAMSRMVHSIIQYGGHIRQLQTSSSSSSSSVSPSVLYFQILRSSIDSLLSDLSVKNVMKKTLQNALSKWDPKGK